MSELPTGWAWATLGDVCEHATKWDPRSSPNETFAYVDIGSIDRQKIVRPVRLAGSEAPSRARQVIRSGDTVLSTVRTYLINTALVPDELDGATASTGFCVLRPTDVINGRFLFYRVVEGRFVEELSQRQTGSSYPAVRDRDVFEQRIALPPLAEQLRIVAAIEEQLSRLDAADASLQVASARARQFKDVVLDSALTSSAPWRRIGELASLSDCPFGSNLKTAHYVASGPRVVRLQNIGDGVFRDERAHITHEHFERLSKHAVVADDVVVASLGDDAPRACLVPNWLGRAIVKADCIRARARADVNPAYLMWALNSRSVRAQAARRIKGIGRPRLGLGGIRELQIPFPPLHEQRRIVGEVEERLSAVDALRSSVEEALRNSAAVRRAILAAAFRGRLVPQDPDDEPASALLERIVGERAAAPKAVRKRSRVESR